VKSFSSCRDSGGKANGSNKVKETLVFRRKSSIDSNSLALQEQSTTKLRAMMRRRSSSRRKLSLESEGYAPECSVRLQSSSQSNIGRRKAVSALALSELGYANQDVRSEAQSVANQRREIPRSHSFRLSGTQDETFSNKNFTWTWKNDEMEPTVRVTNQRSILQCASPSQTKNGIKKKTLGQDFFPSTPTSATRQLSMPMSSDLTRSDHPMSSMITPQRQGKKKISPKRTSKCADSLLSPGARRISRATEHFVSPLERTSSYPNLPLGSPDSTRSNWKKSRGGNLRRQASKSKIIPQEVNALDISRVDDGVNKKDIGAIAMVLKQKNQAEEDLLRQKKEDMEAKRSHIRARRQQSLKLTW